MRADHSCFFSIPPSHFNKQKSHCLNAGNTKQKKFGRQWGVNSQWHHILLLQETLQKLKALQGSGGSTAEEQKAQRMKAAAAGGLTSFVCGGVAMGKEPVNTDGVPISYVVVF